MGDNVGYGPDPEDVLLKLKSYLVTSIRGNHEFAILNDSYKRLKYKMLLGRFEGPADFWRHAPLKVNNVQWGGEVAAYKLTKYLKPEEFIIYADEEYLTNIIIQNRLRKTEDGNIFIFQQFWPEDTYFKKKDIVHPILIYADLLEFKNQRKIETAKLIYDKHILGHFT